MSARSVHELISAPAARQVLLARVGGLKIATMICLDVADYASVASVIKVGDGIDVLLVPCYTKRFEKMEHVAKVASRALPGIVAMVNADLPNVSAKRREVAWFGRLNDPGDGPAFDGAKISVLDVDVAKFREERQEIPPPPR